jgi:hypothetical protein
LLANAARWFVEDIWRAGPGGRLAALRRKCGAGWRQLRNVLRRPDSGRADAEEVFGGSGIPENFRRQVEGHYQALRDYVPKVYAGPVVLLRARTRPLFRLHGHDLGWGRLAGGGLEVVTVPGNHETILKEPNVRVLAEALLTHLRAAQARPWGEPGEGIASGAGRGPQAPGGAPAGGQALGAPGR